jgi:glucose/arabinose dehydrogenase
MPSPAPTRARQPTATPFTAPSATAAAFALAVEVAGRGFAEPLFVTHAGDGSGRVFVVEKAGTIRLLDGSLFLDITDRVGAEADEQGLLGLAFHPGFASNGLLYVNYTDFSGDTVIARFGLDAAGNGDPASELVLLSWDQPERNHNGGMLAFGPDGYLYVGLGDGGGSYDEHQNAQRLDTVLGKILRVDVDGGSPYAIPPDNPFVNTPGARPEVWAHGLRNPWRFSFDRATGELYIADVGQNTWEWVFVQPAAGAGGENYGWPIVEGGECVEEGCDTAGLTLPVHVYPREQGCAIIGGAVYRGERLPALQGLYLFGDLCSGRVWTLARDASGAWSATEALRLDASISSFGEDEAGELYLTDIAGGVVYRFTASPH